MTGPRRSSRHHSIPEKAKPNYAEKQSDPKSQHPDDIAFSEESSNIKPLKNELIVGVRRNSLDDGLEFYYAQAGRWVPGSETPPELLRVWGQKKMPSSSRPSPDPDSEVDDVKDDLAVGLMVHYRQKGKNKAGKSQPFQWVPVGAASFETISAWARREKRRVERSIKNLRKHQIPAHIPKRLLMLEDLLEGEFIEPTKPYCTPDYLSPDQDYSIPPHAPHYPWPKTFNGNCNNATQPSSILIHTNLVAACQSSKHYPNGLSTALSPHLVCTACHDNPPIQRLTQHERDHIIRDGGLFPLCSSCTEAWCEHPGVDTEQTGKICTCVIQLPRRLCADYWLEMARARSRRADGCTECCLLRSERERKGEDVVKEGVLMCSGCQAVMVKRNDQTPAFQREPTYQQS